MWSVGFVLIICLVFKNLCVCLCGGGAQREKLEGRRGMFMLSEVSGQLYGIGSLLPLYEF